MTVEAPTTPLEALIAERDQFVRAAETFMVGTINGFSTVERLLAASAEQHRTEIAALGSSHAEEIQRLKLVATTATAAADEKARGQVATAVAAAESEFAARSARLVAETEARHSTLTQELTDAHNEEVRAIQSRHAAALEDMARESALAVTAAENGIDAKLATEREAAEANVRREFEGKLSEVSQAAERAQEDLRAANQEELARAAEAHAQELADERRKHETKLAGSQALWLASNGDKVAAEGKLAAAEITISELRDKLREAPIATEIEDILYPQAAPVEDLTGPLADALRDLEAARADIQSFTAREIETDTALASLRGQLAAAEATGRGLEEQLRATSERPAAEATCDHEPQDTSAASMRIARTETQTIVRLVAQANPEIKLAEAADLVAAALSGRTEMAIQLPMPVLVGASV